MFNNAALDVVIGLVFIYLLYSLLGTVLVEIIASNTGLRGWLLQKAIERMLDDGVSSRRRAVPLRKSFLGIKYGSKPAKTAKTPKASQAFFVHPLIKYLRANTWLIRRKPSYIDPQTFTKVLIDLLRGPEAKAGDSDRHLIEQTLKTRIIRWKVAGDRLVGGKYLTKAQTPNRFARLEQDTTLYLESVWVDSQGDVTKFKSYITDWFNEMMDRTTGWYKKYTQLILLGIGLVTAGAFNVDTIKIAKLLEANPELRKQMISQVSTFTKANPGLSKQLHDQQDELNKLNKDDKKRDSLQQQIDNNAVKKLQDQETKLIGDYLPDATHTLGLGYERGWQDFNGLMSILGWLLTALAISMGAPFWFDLLNKLMQLRSSLAPKEEPKDKSNTASAPKPTNIKG